MVSFMKRMSMRKRRAITRPEQMIHRYELFSVPDILLRLILENFDNRFFQNPSYRLILSLMDLPHFCNQKEIRVHSLILKNTSI